MVAMPYVTDNKDGRGYDLTSLLLKDRIVLPVGEVDDVMAASMGAEESVEYGLVDEVLLPACSEREG